MLLYIPADIDSAGGLEVCYGLLENGVTENVAKVVRVSPLYFRWLYT